MKLSEKARKSLNTVVERFRAGDLAPVVEVARRRIHLDPSAPAASWSMSNQVIAYAQTGCLDCRGYRQWQAAGRQVQKGERAGYILGPRIVKKEEDGEEKSFVAGFFAIPVFGLEQTEGEEIPRDYAPAELPPLMDVARALGIRTDYVPLPPDRLGDYTPARDHIRLGDHDPMTFWHELAHAVHTRIMEDISTVSQARRETIAELTAAVIAEMYGLDYSGNCWRYIEAYNAQDPLAAIAKALGDIEKILSVIENATGGGSHETA